MNDFIGFGDLVEQINAASRTIEASDNTLCKRIDGLEQSIHDLWKKTGRPGAEADDIGFERKSATEMCHMRRAPWMLPST